MTYNYLVFTTDMPHAMLIYICKYIEELLLTHYNGLV